MYMPIFATSWTANCDCCHHEVKSPEGVLSLEAFIRLLEEDGWDLTVNRRACEIRNSTCPICLKSGG